MCLATFIPAGVAPKEEFLFNGWCGNSDGGGFAYIRKGKVKVVKSLMTWKDWNEAYKKARADNPTSPFLVHFRIRSAGGKDANNTHPFIIPTGAMIHNGTIQGTGANYQNGASDTQIFVDTFKEKLTYEILNKNKDEIGKLIGYNKLAFLFNGGKHVIINEKDGIWNEGAWYSNGSFRSYVRSGDRRQWEY